VVVDTGYLSSAHQTLALLREPEHLGDRSLQLVVNTHCHSDHMGGNALLARTYRSPVVVPEREAALIGKSDTQALWVDYADQRAERFAVSEELLAGRKHRCG
jgi:glyoxylase-like metal-dependent hydrolase (beta-lactamase superfamily II)